MVFNYLNHSFNSSLVFLKVAIVAQDLAAFHAASSEMGHQQHSHHLVTTETRPLTLVATSNGTQIAVQVGTVAAVPSGQQCSQRLPWDPVLYACPSRRGAQGSLLFSLFKEVVCLK